MLVELSIENLALVKRIEIAFDRGLNVLTGETGAGKSVLVNALSLVLGGRANTDAVRTGTEAGVVEALFQLPTGSPWLERLRRREIDVEGGEVLVRRVVPRAGRGKTTINGHLVTLSMLTDVMRGMIDLTGQHEHVSLLDPEGHLAIVDAYGELEALRSDVASAHSKILGYRTGLDALLQDEAEKARREDYLRFALEEIDGIDPKLGEIEALEDERKRLKNVADLTLGIRRAEGALYSDDGAIIEVVGRVQGELQRLSRMDDRLASLSGTASSMLAELEDLARQLGRYQSMLCADPERLQNLEERVEALRKLTRKYGGTIAGVLAERERMAEELESLSNEEARRADISSALEAELERRREHALRLSGQRHKVVRSLEKAVQSELFALCMEKTRLEIELRMLPEISYKGAEIAEIMISSNPGEPLRPLKRIASGGELSRILLAIKHVLANKSEVGTYVFDEIDTGIGGAVADILGQKLRDVALNHQVICVTHLPQVAAHADKHFLVQKGEIEGRTITSVRALEARDRIEEMARMLGGQKITERTRSLAQEMLSSIEGGAWSMLRP